jgi:hypothetical protein
MQPSTRYAVSAVVGVTAAGLAHVAAAPVVDTTRTWVTTVLTGLVWLVAVALYLDVLCRLGSTDGSAKSGASVAAKWGGIAGGVVGIGIAGTALVLVDLVTFRFVAAVGLFVFGFGMASMSVGMGVVADRLDAADGREAGASSGPNAGTNESAVGDD